MIDLLIITLATWYVSYAVTSTHGPGSIFDWVRENVWHGRRWVKLPLGEMPSGVNIDLDKQRMYPNNGLLDCPVCLAFWAGLILLLVPMGIVVQALAVAGAAMLLHGWAGWRFGND